MLSTNYNELMQQFLANKNEKKYQYIISRGVRGTKYYYYDFDMFEGYQPIELHQLVWTQQRKLAFPFQTEQEVEEFKAEYVSPRKASIIRVVKPPHTLMDLIG